MIEILPQSTGNVIGLRVNGKLVHEDYQQFIPKLEAIIEEYGCMRCYCEMVNFQGITWQALMDEIQFDVKHCNQIERCAVVSDSSWDQWMTDFTKMIFRNSQVECFTPNQTEEAWNWVTGETEYAGSVAGSGSQNQSCGCTGNTNTNYGNTNTNTNTNKNTNYNNPTNTNNPTN